MSQTPSPAYSIPELTTAPKHFAVANGLLFDYYPIKLGARVGNFVSIEKMPEVLAEGFVTYNRKLYHLTFRDFFRRRVNVERPYTARASTGTTGTSSSAGDGGRTNSDNSPVVESGVSGNQSGSSANLEIQLGEIADLAWEDQIRTLLHAIDPEEEWVDPEIAQS